MPDGDSPAPPARVRRHHHNHLIPSGKAVIAFQASLGACVKICWRTAASAASFPEAVLETEEVVPVNVSTWVLPSGVTVGR